MIFLTNPIVLVRKSQLVNKSKMTHFHCFTKMEEILDFVFRENVMSSSNEIFLNLEQNNNPTIIQIELRTV